MPAVTGTTSAANFTLFEQIALSAITVSPTNPRGRTDAKGIAELVDSIRTYGVMQPVLVRPHPKFGVGHYELVAGHRRFAASKAAGLESIPATVRELTDSEAYEYQLTENIQRADIHPLDEAEGYRELTTKHGYTVEQLAKKIGKSRAYVYQRLALANLSPEAKKLIAVDDMNVSIALLVARIPNPELQKQAAEKIAAGQLAGYDMGKEQRRPYTAAEARELVSETYMLDMKSAPFNILDADLHPAAGPCSTCPKRTGNAVDLFGDLGKGNDLCTDPPCFAQKKANAWHAATEKNRKAGHTVLSIEESEKVMPSHMGGSTTHGSAYVRPTDLEWAMDSGGTYAQLAEKHGVEPQIYAARNPKTGKPTIVWKKAEVLKAVTAVLKGKEKPAAAEKSEQESDARDDARDSFVHRAKKVAVVKALLQSVSGMSDHEALKAVWRALVDDSLNEFEAEALGLGSDADLDKGLFDLVDDGDKLRGMMAWMLVDVHGYWDDVKHLGIDVRKVEAAAEKAARAEYAAKKKAEAKAAAATPAPVKPAAKKGGKK